MSLRISLNGVSKVPPDPSALPCARPLFVSSSSLCCTLVMIVVLVGVLQGVLDMTCGRYSPMLSARNFSLNTALAGHSSGSLYWTFLTSIWCTTGSPRPSPTPSARQPSRGPAAAAAKASFDAAANPSSGATAACHAALRRRLFEPGSLRRVTKQRRAGRAAAHGRLPTLARAGLPPCGWRPRTTCARASARGVSPRRRPRDLARWPARAGAAPRTAESGGPP